MQPSNCRNAADTRSGKPGNPITRSHLQVASNTTHRTSHHQPSTECHACCTSVPPQHLSNNECNHLLWCPHNILGNQCNCQCNMIRTEVHLSCRNHLARSHSWAP